MSAYRVLDFEVAYVRMDDHETLIDQQGAERKPQMNHFTFLRSRPGSQVPDCDRASNASEPSALIKWSCLSLLERQTL